MATITMTDGHRYTFAASAGEPTNVTLCTAGETISDQGGLGYLTEWSAKEGFVTLHLTSISYENLEFVSEASMLIKKDDSRYNYNFTI